MDTIRHILTHRREALRGYAVRGPASAVLFEFVAFGIKQAWACIFGGAFLAILLATHFWWPSDAPLARYDFLVFAAVAIQVLLLLSGLETWEEARVILVFHIVGTLMEIFKTEMGSWAYTEAGMLKIAGVPLFSGFMYAAIGSYLARVWRIFDFRFYALSSPLGSRPARGRDLCELLRSSLYDRHSQWLVCRRSYSLCALRGLVSRRPETSANAAGRRFWPRRAVYLGCREYCDICPRMDLSRTGERMVTGLTA